jgi:Fe-S cluster assembly protein SufD
MIQEEILVRDKIDSAFSRNSVEQISSQNGEPQWMLNKRLRALTIYEEMPQSKRSDLPVSSRLDASGLSLEKLQLFSEAGGSNAPAMDAISSVQAQRSASLLLRNNLRVDKDHLGGKLPKGTIYTDIGSALREHPDLIQKYFMSTNVQLNENRFVALHGAFWNGGTFLYVPKNVKIEFPIHSFYTVDRKSSAFFPHTIIVAEEGSSVTFIDSHSSPTTDSQSLVDGVVEIFAGERSEVNYISLQEYGRNVYHYSLKRLHAKKDSNTTWCEIGLGSKLSKCNIEAVMQESGVNVNMLGLYFPVADQQMEFDTLQIHEAPHATSDLLYKGALRDKARSIFEGLIRVNKGAQKTNAYQANRNMLLSSESRADSIPKLEIEANDVRCTHGATVGPINEDQLFYLMSRGLPKEAATHLLVLGFFSEVLDRIPVQDIREELLNQIERQID